MHIKPQIIILSFELHQDILAIVHPKLLDLLGLQQWKGIQSLISFLEMGE